MKFKNYLLDRIQSSFLLSDFIKQINLICWWSKRELVSIHTMPHRYEATDCSLKGRYFSKFVIKKKMSKGLNFYSCATMFHLFIRCFKSIRNCMGVSPSMIMTHRLPPERMSEGEQPISDGNNTTMDKENIPIKQHHWFRSRVLSTSVVTMLKGT